MEYRAELKGSTTPIPQYSLPMMLSIWAAAAVPMGIIGWVVAPALAADPHRPGFERLAAITAGLAWQFVLVVILLRREGSTFTWADLNRRLWLNAPRDPRTGETRRRLWLWIIPLVILTAAYQALGQGSLSKLWVSAFPFLAEPPGFSLGASLGSPEARAQLLGAWGTWGLYLLQALFNTVIGEELLFRGLLLPRMAGVFGRRDWAANALLFGLYHLHQPWNMLGSTVGGALFYALPSRHFRCAWFGIIAHSGQSVLLAVLILGLVLGLSR